MDKFKLVLQFFQQLIISKLISLQNANIGNLCTAAILTRLASLIS